MNDPSDYTGRYRHEGDRIVDTMTGESVSLKEMPTLTPAAPPGLLEEAQDNLLSDSVIEVDEDEPDTTCGCGDCFNCAVDELSGLNEEGDEDEIEPDEEDDDFDEPEFAEIGGEA